MKYQQSYDRWTALENIFNMGFNVYGMLRGSLAQIRLQVTSNQTNCKIKYVLRSGQEA